MVFLKALLYILTGYYILKFALRVFGPWLLAYVAKRTGERFQAHFRATTFETDAKGNDRYARRKAPKSAKKGPVSAEKVGEYIDFEEVD